MIIQSLKEYFDECPLLDELKKLNVNYLGVNPTEYTLDNTPVDPIVKEYTDGSKIKQFVFVFGSRDFYGDDVAQNIESSGFYEKLDKWLNYNTMHQLLPELSDGRVSIKIEAMSSGYLFNESENSARYQIQCRLVYFEPR